MAELSRLPTLDPLDRRLNAISREVTDLRLKDHINAERYTEGEPGWISTAMADLSIGLGPEKGIDTQLIYGERVRIFDNRGDRFWIQNELDNYVGWVDAGVIKEGHTNPTHVVCVPRTFFYPAPDLKLRHKGMRSLGSQLCVTEFTENRGTRYAILASGEAVIARHIRPISKTDIDYVSVAETLMNTPYLWAGTSAFGIDCSGLVKLALFMTGERVFRDSDMQAATIGDEIDPGQNYENLIRGDLAFWRGHVAICQGGGMIIHANGNTMNVASEPLEEAIERIAYLYDLPIGFRRP